MRAFSNLIVPVVANIQTGTSYNLVLGDMGKVVEVDSAEAATVTIPPDVFPTGAVVVVAQVGAGQVSLVAGTGVVLLPEGESLTLRTKGSEAVLRHRGSNEWVVGGDLEGAVPSGGLPAGGDAGQMLAKASGTDYDTEWVDAYTASEVDAAIGAEIGAHEAVVASDTVLGHVKIWQGTQSAYDLIDPPDANTIYLIVEE